MQDAITRGEPWTWRGAAAQARDSMGLSWGEGSITYIGRSQNRPLQGPQQFSTEAKWWRLQYRASPRDKKINNTCSTDSKAESVCPKLEILFLRQTYQMMWKISSPRPCGPGWQQGGTPSPTISPESLSPTPQGRNCFYCHDSDDSGPLALCWGPMRPFPLNPAPWDQALVSLRVQADNCQQGADNCTLRGCPVPWSSPESPSGF